MQLAKEFWKVTLNILLLVTSLFFLRLNTCVFYDVRPFVSLTQSCYRELYQKTVEGYQFKGVCDIELLNMCHVCVGSGRERDVSKESVTWRVR